MVFNLSEKEFLFLCFAAGATKVIGIEDAFKNINTDDMSSEIRKVHNSLEGKNYIESDFDGNSLINKILLDYIRVCVSCEKIAMFNSSKENCFETINYYVDNEFCIKAKKEDGFYTLSKISIDELQDDYMSNISFRNANKFNTNYEIIFKQKELEQIKCDLRTEKKEKTLSQLKTRIKDEFLEVIVSALEEKEDFYALAIINNMGENLLETIMIIDAEKGALIVQPQIVDLENAVRFITCNQDEISSLINRFVKKITE